MFCALLVHKFGINVKHKTQYLAVELHNYVNENDYAVTSCACLVGLQISRNWDCWVSSLSTPNRLLIETTQFMFHTLKGKGKKINMFCKGCCTQNLVVLKYSLLMWGFEHQIYSLTRHSFHGCHSQPSGAKSTETACKRSQDELRALIVCWCFLALTLF
jgi:hypothetical protein